MDIFDSEGSIRHDISEAVEAIFRYLEKYPIPPNCFANPAILARFIETQQRTDLNVERSSNDRGKVSNEQSEKCD